MKHGSSSAASSSVGAAQVSEIKSALGIANVDDGALDRKAPGFPPMGTPVDDLKRGLVGKLYKFGTAAAATAAGEVAVTNTAQLAAAFNPYQGYWDGSGYIGPGKGRINTEIQCYAPIGGDATSPSSHLFEAGAVRLQASVQTGTLGHLCIAKPVGGGITLNTHNGGGWIETPNANFGVVEGSLAAVEVGTVLTGVGAGALAFVGYVRAKTGTGLTIEILFSQGLAHGSVATQNRPFVFHRFGAARPTQAYPFDTAQGTNFVLQTALPSYCVGGMSIMTSGGAWAPNWSGTSRINAVAGNKLSFTLTDKLQNQIGAAGDGGYVLVTPSLYSAQLWSRDTFGDPEMHQVSYVRARVTLPAVTGYHVKDAPVDYTAEGFSAFKAAHPDEPLGYWLGVWTYYIAPDWDTINSGTQPWDEDDFEIFVNFFAGSKEIGFNTHTEKTSGFKTIRPSDRKLHLDPNGVPYVGGVWMDDAASSQGGLFKQANVHHLKKLIMDGQPHDLLYVRYGRLMVDHYIDGIHVCRTWKRNPKSWLPSQLGINLSLGGWDIWYMPESHHFPYSNTHVANSFVKVHEVEILTTPAV